MFQVVSIIAAGLLSVALSEEPPSPPPTNQFLTSLSLHSINNAHHYTNLAHQLTSSIDLLSSSALAASLADASSAATTEELAQRLSTAKSELETAAQMFMRVSTAAAKAMVDTTAVSSAISTFVQVAKANVDPSSIANSVVEVDRANTIATQSTSSLLFAIQSSSGSSCSKVHHSINMLVNVTRDHEHNVNATMDTLYSLLQNMVGDQQRIDNEIAATAFNILSRLPPSAKGDDVTDEMYATGNVTLQENDVKTKLLLSALRNITLTKYYSNALTSKISTLLDIKNQPRIEENNAMLSELGQVMHEMTNMLTSLSIYTHLAQDGNATALQALSALDVPEQRQFLSHIEYFPDTLKNEEALQHVYYDQDVKEIFTLLRLALENEHLTASIPHTVIDPINVERLKEADKATTTLLNQAVLRSTSGAPKLTKYLPDSASIDHLNATEAGTKIMHDMLGLAQDDLQKGHLRPAEDYVDGRLIVEGSGESSAPHQANDALSTEEQDALDNTLVNNNEQKVEDTMMKDEAAKIAVEKNVQATSTDAEADKEEKIVALQNEEMLLHQKKSEELDIMNNEKSEYSVLKMIDGQRKHVEEKASHALNVQAQAAESWFHYQNRNHSNEMNGNQGQNVNDTARDTVTDQLKLHEAVHHMITALQTTNKLEEDLATYRTQALDSEVSKSKAAAELKEAEGEPSEATAEAASEATAETADGRSTSVLDAARVAAREQDVVRSLVKERSSVGIEADVEIQKLAEDRAQSIGVKKTPSPLLESLLVAKARYAGAMMRLVRSHKNVAHEALQNVEQTRKEEVQRQQLKLNQNQYLSRETKLLLAQKDTVHLAQQEFQSFFRRPFTKEQVAKEMSGQKALGLGH